MTVEFEACVTCGFSATGGLREGYLYCICYAGPFCNPCYEKHVDNCPDIRGPVTEE